MFYVTLVIQNNVNDQQISDKPIHCWMESLRPRLAVTYPIYKLFKTALNLPFSINNTPLVQSGKNVLRTASHLRSFTCINIHSLTFRVH